jgi:hypothetical protein
MPDWVFHWTGYTLAAIAGLLLLLALFRDRARGQSRCRMCWYDLTEIGDLPITCPECGKAHTKPRHLRKTRRHKCLAMLWLLVMVVGGYGLWVVPRVVDRGWYGAVPTTGLVLPSPWVNDKWIFQHPRWGGLRSELSYRIRTDSSHLYWRVTARYWSHIDTNLWAGEIDEIVEPNSVADSCMYPLLMRGYGSQHDLSRHFQIGGLHYSGIELYLVPIRDDQNNIVAYKIDRVAKAPSNRRELIYLADQAELEKPELPYTQMQEGFDGDIQDFISSKITVPNSDNGQWSTLIWVEGLAGQDLGSYRVVWALDRLNEAEDEAVLTVKEWELLPD